MNPISKIDLSPDTLKPFRLEVVQNTKPWSARILAVQRLQRNTNSCKHCSFKECNSHDSMYHTPWPTPSPDMRKKSGISCVYESACQKKQQQKDTCCLPGFVRTQGVFHFTRRKPCKLHSLNEWTSHQSIVNLWGFP